MSSHNKWMLSLIAAMLVFATVLTAVAGFLPADVSAATSSQLKEELKELQNQKQEISAKLEELEKQQQDNLNDMQALIAQKDVIDQQVALLHEEITNVNRQISAYSLLIAEKQKELEEAEERYEELNKKHKARIRAMEEQGKLSYWAVLFNANSFSDFLDRVNMVAEIAAADTRRLKELSSAAEEIRVAREELTEDKAELEKRRVDLEKSQEELGNKSAEADWLLQELIVVSGDLDSLYDQFEKEEEDFLDQIANKENQYNQQLQSEIKASQQASKQASKEASKQASIKSSVKASQQASQNQASKPNTGTDKDDSNPSGVVWLVPCKYSRVSSKFGYRHHPTTGEWSMHKGVDLAANKGTPIYASRSGTVTTATYHNTAGNYVTINHGDGYSSTYMHMTHYVVKKNQYVEAGQLIGYVGSTGRSTGPHLHFGIIRNGVYVNPMDYIK